MQPSVRAQVLANETTSVTRWLLCQTKHHKKHHHKLPYQGLWVPPCYWLGPLDVISCHFVSMSRPLDELWGNLDQLVWLGPLQQHHVEVPMPRSSHNTTVRMVGRAKNWRHWKSLSLLSLLSLLPCFLRQEKFQSDPICLHTRNITEITKSVFPQVTLTSHWRHIDVTSRCEGYAATRLRGSWHVSLGCAWQLDAADQPWLDLRVQNSELQRSNRSNTSFWFILIINSEFQTSVGTSKFLKFEMWRLKNLAAEISFHTQCSGFSQRPDNTGRNSKRLVWAKKGCVGNLPHLPH